MPDRAATFRRLLGAGMAVLAAFLLLAPRPWNASTGPGFFATPGRTITETVLTAGWWAALVNLGLAALLWATARWWAGPLPAPPAAGRPARTGRVFALALLAAVALGGALRWNLAHGSLWWDELWSVKRAVVGWREPVADAPVPPVPPPAAAAAEADGTEDGLTFHRVKWHWTLFHYKKPTNHVFYNLVGRASTTAWRRITGAPPHAFDAFAFRLPAFLAGLASIAGVGWLLREWGFARAGAAAAFFLALHPWHVRYGVEGRAYSFVVLGTLASAWLLTRALRDGSWRHWIPYGALQWLMFWTHPFSVYVSLALGAAGVAGVLADPRWGAARWRAAARPVVASLAAGMLVLQVMAPNFAQVPFFSDVHEPGPGRTVGEGQVDKLVARVFTGVPKVISRGEPDREDFPSLDAWGETRPWLAPLVYRGLPLLALVGLAAAALRPPPVRFAALGLAAAAPLALAAAWAGDQFFHRRFVIYALAAAAAFVPLGLATLVRGATAFSPRAQRVAVPAVLALGLAGFQVLVWPQTALLLARPIAPMRDVAELLRARARDHGVPTLRGGYGLGGDMTRLYDPWIVPVEGARGVAGLCQRAVREGRPLYVFYGYPEHNRTLLPGGFRYLDDPALFRPLARIDGVEASFDFRVLRHTGRACPPPEGVPDRSEREDR